MVHPDRRDKRKPSDGSSIRVYSAGMVGATNERKDVARAGSESVDLRSRVHASNNSQYYIDRS